MFCEQLLGTHGCAEFHFDRAHMCIVEEEE